GVVLRATDQDVHGEARDADALRVDAGAVEIELLDDLGVEVAELRTHHRERVPRRRTRRRRHEEVRRVPAGGGGGGQCGGGGRGGAAAASAGGMRGSMLWMESASGTTEPVTGPPVSTGYLNLRLIVVGASGSSASMTSDQALKPVSAPSVCSSLASRFALAASPPPPAPKIDPMNAVTA